MKKYYFNDYIIIKLNNYLKKQYKSNYLITFNRDIFGFSDTLKEAKKNIKSL